MYLWLWFKRFFFSSKHLIKFSPLISITSLTLAVGSLVLAMSVYSGYEQTIKKSVVDMTGHLMITTRKQRDNKNHLISKIQSEKKFIKSYLAFLSLNALLVHEGKLTGILLEGVDKNFRQTLKLTPRLKTGTYKLQKPNSALIGKNIAQKFNLKPGHTFHIVIPNMNKDKSFQKKHKSFYVEGVLDFGFYDFNSRYIITRLHTLQNLIQRPQAISGVRTLVKNPSMLKKLKQTLRQKLNKQYAVQDWQDLIKNLSPSYFYAVQKEKFLIFFILMILVIAGAFNVSSHLSICVLNQTREISILKVMGSKKIFIFSLFLGQGMLISLVGAIAGILLGLGLSKGLVFVQSIHPIVPEDVYKVTTIITSLKPSDIILILICSQVICLLSCLFPALRALKLSLREGLHSE